MFILIVKLQCVALNPSGTWWNKIKQCTIVTWQWCQCLYTCTKGDHHARRKNILHLCWNQIQLVSQFSLGQEHLSNTVFKYMEVIFGISFPNSFDRLCRSHVMQYHCGYCKLEYLWGYYKGNLMLLWQGLLCIRSLQSTLIVPPTALPTCSSHIGTTWYEIHVAGQEKSGCAPLNYNISTFRGNCTPNQDWAWFVSFFKIMNTFWKLIWFS